MTDRLEDYEVLNVIGTGSFGTCYKVRRRSNGHFFVWKAVGYGGMSEEKKQLLVSEVNLLSELRHPNIVQYYDRIIHKETTTLYIIMEWCEGGDLASIISKSKKGGTFLDEGFIWRVLYQMCRALQACHWHLSKVTVLHRDIKPANVFLDGTGNVKLGDFGLARMLHSDKSFAHTFVGTPYYMSPEVIKGGKYNKKSDIWSLGCLIYELCSLSPPFTGSNIKHLALKIKEGTFSRIPVHYSDDLQKIISLLLTVDLSIRPTIEMILHHPMVVSHIARETFKNECVAVGGKIEKEDINDSSSMKQNLQGIYKHVTHKSILVSEKENIISCTEKVRDTWLNRLHLLKQREASLRVKELTIDERERAVAKKEKQIALLDRIAKEKMARADVYLRQCREVRSTTSSNKNIQQHRYTINEDLDTSASADPGDTSILPTSARLKPERITKPSPFVKVGLEKHVHFDTLPVNKLKPKSDGSLELASKQSVSQYEELPCSFVNRVLHNIYEEVPSRVMKLHNRYEDEQVTKTKSALHDLQIAEQDNFRNGVISVLTTNHCSNKLDPISAIRPFETTSWKEEQTIWLENKRRAHLYGTMRAHRNTFGQRAKTQDKAVTNSVPKNIPDSLLGFR